MKKLIVLSLFAVIMVSAVGLPSAVQSQSPGNDLKPTFISPTPGLYVNGWPAFTVSYPKEWVEVPSTGPGSVFMALAVRPGSYPSPVLGISVFPSPLPLKDWAKLNMPTWEQLFTDIKILSDKASQLKDGTPTREVEVEFVPKIDTSGRSNKNVPKRNAVLLSTKKDLTWVAIFLADDQGKLGEDLRNVAHSLTFQPGREEPVTVPSDVRAFLDMFCADMVSGDVKAIMSHYSDRFRFSGGSKAFYEQVFRNDPDLQRGLISYEPTPTLFEPQGDKAYLDGFFTGRLKGDANALKLPMLFQQIIKEHGQWKWHGNQK
jgi:hypothetical protein